jgi:hypothetical protein
VISYTEKVCHVAPYHSDYGPIQDVPVMKGATAYTDSEMGKTYILIINEALYLGDTMRTSYLNPNQLRHHGLVVNDVPKHLSINPNDDAHSIFLPLVNLRIPLHLKGIISYIPIRYPSDDELNSCEWFDITSDKDWDPASPLFEEKEEQTIQNMINPLIYYPRSISDISTSIATLDPEINPQIHNQIRSMRATVSHTQNHSTNLRNKISRNFGIGLKTAERTLQDTPPLALRQAIHPLHRRFQTEVAQLRYPRLGGPHGKFHTDTFFANVPSLSRCTMGQLYTNDVHFTKFYPMHQKSKVADTLTQLMQDVGIPSDLHSDDAMELTQGRMGDMLKKFWIKPSQSEPYSPWQVQAELCILEIKKAVRMSLDRTQAPRRLWDCCTRYHSEIRNLTAHPIFRLEGRTPYEIVCGRTPDILEYLDNTWYETVWYYDQEANFPEPRRKMAK